MPNEGKDDYVPDPKKIEQWERLSKAIKTAKQREEQGIVQLELTSELQESGIVERFEFYPKTSGIMLVLNHLYDRKLVVCNANTKNWDYTTKNFKNKLKERGITNKDHVKLLSEVLDVNYDKIRRLQQEQSKYENKKDRNDYDHSKSTRSEAQAETEAAPVIQPLDIPFEQWQSKLLEKYEALRTMVANNLPSLWNALEFGLSVKTILNIKGCTLPFAGIILDPPSSLKTVVIELLKKQKRANPFHTHSFSPKSFVSHSTAVKREDLQFVDLLPKIKNKLFLTPELAPIFSARDEDLLQMLSILTSVLDGHGFESDTGAQGHRGYNEDIMFTWLGAVVDIPFRVHKQLSQLGAKLYFYRLPRLQQEEEDYFNHKSDDFAKKVQAISQSLSEYLDYFDANPSITFESGNGNENKSKLPKIQLDESRDEELAHRYIIRLGMLLAPLRAIVPTWETKDTQGSEYAYAMAIIEDPSRAITQLRNLARGHAVSKGRNYIKVEDIPMLIKVVLSTCSIERQTIFEILLEHGGVMTTSQIVDSLNITSPTARRTMTELKATGLVSMYDVSAGTYNSEKQISLKPEFKWFLSEDFRTLKEKCPPSTKENNENKEENKNKEALRGENSFNQNDVPDAEIVIPDSVYRLGHSDLFACKSCKVKGDKWFMLTHPVNCKARNNQNKLGGDKIAK